MVNNMLDFFILAAENEDSFMFFFFFYLIFSKSSKWVKTRASSAFLTGRSAVTEIPLVV